MTTSPYRSREYKTKAGAPFAWAIVLLCIAAFLAFCAFVVADPAWVPPAASEPGWAMVFAFAFEPLTRALILGLATAAVAAGAFGLLVTLSRRKPVLKLTGTEVLCSTAQGVRALAWADVTDVKRMGGNLLLTGPAASLVIPVDSVDAPLGEIETLVCGHLARTADGARAADAPVQDTSYSAAAVAARAAGPDYSATAATFETKVLKAKWALVFEQVWLRLWLLLALAAAFVLVSLAGVWPLLGPVPHFLLMSTFALAALAWLVFTARIDWPSRETAIRRIENVSGIPHRPATSYEDTLTASAGDATTVAIWQAHRARMAGLIGKLKSGMPAPRTDRIDPFALRALLVLFIVLAGAFAGRGGLGQLMDAFRFGSSSQLADARLDAWVTPPDYTGRAPIMLADGANPIAKAPATSEPVKPLEVPEKSTIIVRSSGIARAALAMEIVTPGQDKPVRVEAAKDNTTGAVSEVRTVLETSAKIRVLAGGNVLAEWPITIIPDNIPGIALTKNPEKTPRGAMKLTYFVQDDYGVASAEVKFERAKKKDTDPAKAWAKKEPLTGPRPPLSRPPVLALRLPGPNAKDGESFTYHEMGSHPWAGQRVMMTLEAKDVGGKTGRSQSVEMILPERAFTKPLAKAVVEQRKKLLEDPRYRGDVMVALDALTLEAEGYIEDPRVYLGLRAAYYRLERDQSRAGMTSVIEQLWHTALRIEDGDLSEAERALRDAQDRLAKALEEGASDEEIQKLMQELKQAFNEFAKQMGKENEKQDNAEQNDGRNQDQQTMSQEDLDRMMREMEEMAKNGSREQAKEMLAEMRDLMERMQSSKQDPKQAQKSQDAQKMIRKLGEAVGEQQDIMDETFEQQRQQEGQQGGQMKEKGQGGAKGQRGKNGQQAQKGGGEDGQGDDQGEMGSRGERGEGPEGRGGQKGKSQAQLAERQKALREKLDKLRREMQEKGLGEGEKLDQAGKSMESAEQALNQDDLAQANQDQGEALDAMRESAQQMAQQMQQNGQQRAGQEGESPRDPFGRPQRSQGPDQGTSVKVPDQIDMQRAREILDELRKRVGDAKRPPVELDYLERLLRRF